MGMESPGKFLRTEREHRNLSLAEVAAGTRIKEHLLRALEEDRYDVFPAPLYVRGFLSAYAKYLGLEPREILLRYDNHLRNLPLPPSPVSRLPRKQIPRKPLWTTKDRAKRRPFAFYIIAGGLLFALFVYGLYELSQRVATSPWEKKSVLTGSKSKTHITAKAIPKEISKVDEIAAKDAIRRDASPYEVLEVDLGKGIELEGGRSIFKEKCSEFRCNDQRVYFFTRIKVQREGRIAHLWFREGKEFQRIEMGVQPPAWTVYSFITLRPGYAGNWIAELRDGDIALARKSFRAVEAPPF